MQRVLAIVIAAQLLAGGISAWVMTRPETGTRAGRQVDAGGEGRPRPGPGQARVTGEVTELAIETGAVEPLQLPLTLDALERGAGRARIEPATVDGRPGAVLVWDSGRALPIAGAGSIDMAGAAQVTVVDGQLRVLFDGAARLLPPGTFQLGSTVAVGRSGLAQPRDNVRFATDGTTLQTSGGVFTVVDRMLRVEGPSPLTVRGQLTMEHPDGETTSVVGVDFAGGPLVAELTPTASGWHIDVLLQGSAVAVS